MGHVQQRDGRWCIVDLVGKHGRVRTIQVPSTILLSRLHDAFQAVMGWTDSHMHQWEKDGLYWGVPEHYEEDGIEVIDESKVPVRRVLRAEGETMVYVYDLGDNWRHQVVLEKILPSDAPTKPVCIAGERRCPPEDVGGPSGYQKGFGGHLPTRARGILTFSWMGWWEVPDGRA